MLNSNITYKCAFGLLLSFAAFIPLRAAEELTAQQVVERSVTASGGMENYRSLETLAFNGHLNMPGIGLAGPFDIYYQAPDKVLIKIELGNVATVEQGRNGDVAWEKSTATGSRRVSSNEADEFLESVGLKAVFEMDSVYEDAKMEGIETVGESECYKLTFKRKSNGERETIYYSTTTFLPVKSVASRTSAEGVMKVITTFKEYKKFEGLMIAVKLTNEIPEMNLTQEIEFKKVEINKPVDSSNFEVPDEFAKSSK